MEAPREVRGESEWVMKVTASEMGAKSLKRILFSRRADTVGGGDDRQM